MCTFFSFCEINGKYLYFNAEQRKKILNNEGEFKGLDYNPDSHTSIADYYGYKGAKEDLLIRHEYNPLLSEFIIDQSNRFFRTSRIGNSEAMKWVKSLDFKTIVPELIIKPFVNPFEIEPPQEILPKHITLLKKWASARRLMEGLIWASVRASTLDSVGVSVIDSIGDSIEDLIADSIWITVGSSIWASVRDSSKNAVLDSIRESVRDSIWAYISSFFDVWNGENTYQSCIDLWEMGLVPAYDKKRWYLISKKGIAWKEEGRVK